MITKKELDIETMIYLEKYIKENANIHMTLSEFIKIIANFSEEERNYIIIARLLPKEEISKAINYYDGQNFPIKVDELSFINSLSNKYSVDKNTIIKRIYQVRIINKFEKNQNKNQLKVKKRKK